MKTLQQKTQSRLRRAKKMEKGAPPVPAPRYDEVFAEGARALDGCARCECVFCQRDDLAAALDALLSAPDIDCNADCHHERDICVQSARGAASKAAQATLARVHALRFCTDYIKVCR